MMLVYLVDTGRVSIEAVLVGLWLLLVVVGVVLFLLSDRDA